MAHANRPSPPLLPSASPSQIALASFANMSSIGTVYALSLLQYELTRLLGVSHRWSFAPFGVACAGLSIGVSICASLIAKSGARAIAARGTSLWGLAVIGTGYFLARLNFEGILACLFFGGIGVGWTYLAVVIMIGQGFPNQPLAGAIGPLGFSSSTAACIALSSFFEFGSLSAEKLGQNLSLGGILFLTIGAATMMLLPRDEEKNTPSALSETTPGNSIKRFFSILLFFNALPGMMAFAALLPITSYYRQGLAQSDPLQVLPYGMMALTFGGLLAPTLSSQLGARMAFVILFCLRGIVLILFSLSSETPAVAMIALVTVLFAHGTGFSILPGLIKAQQQADPGQFPSCYGQVLTAWGEAGIVAILINAALISSSGEATVASLVIGLLALTFSASLYFVPSFGGACLP